MVACSAWLGEVDAGWVWPSDPAFRPQDQIRPDPSMKVLPRALRSPACIAVSDLDVRTSRLNFCMFGALVALLEAVQAQVVLGHTPRSYSAPQVVASRVLICRQPPV